MGRVRGLGSRGLLLGVQGFLLGEGGEGGVQGGFQNFSFGGVV